MIRQALSRTTPNPFTPSLYWYRDTGPCTWPCWTLWGSHGPAPSASQGQQWLPAPSTCLQTGFRSEYNPLLTQWGILQLDGTNPSFTKQVFWLTCSALQVMPQSVALLGLGSKTGDRFIYHLCSHVGSSWASASSRGHSASASLCAVHRTLEI